MMARLAELPKQSKAEVLAALEIAHNLSQEVYDQLREMVELWYEYTLWDIHIYEARSMKKKGRDEKA